jgi:exodeoxyribonuclease III
MRIASWNVNSVRSRLEHLTAWLARAAPDVACLQETKVEDERFPEEAIAEAGYRSLFTGQKAYNGVAILTRFGLTAEDPKKNLDGDGDDAPRRAISCTVDGVRILNVYVPNGQAVGSPAFAYKLAWFERLRMELSARFRPDEHVLVCGDFNVAPEPIDVYDPKSWDGHVLFHPDERAALARLQSWGLVDLVRTKNPSPGVYSWWDYRTGAFRRNRGLRIDLALATPALAERCTSAVIDRRPRELARPSDHAPVVVELSV